MTFYNKQGSFFIGIALARKLFYCSFKHGKSRLLVLSTLSSLLAVFNARAQPLTLINEPIQACVVARDQDLTNAVRAQLAECLGWQDTESSPLCLGTYQPLVVQSLGDAEQVRILADRVSLYQNKPSKLNGHVEVQQDQRVVNAQTASLYRDPNTKQVTKIEFLGEVHYLEPDRLMIARTVVINPVDKSGEATDVIYRFSNTKTNAVLPAWGRASFVKRLANKDYLMGKATYTTCAPQDKAWDIRAESIEMVDATATGYAKHATVRLRGWPVLYTPYLEFPTDNKRRSGFLMPQTGFSNLGGFNFAVPYYLNLAPNYDMTITPTVHTERGVMLGDEFRFLSTKSYGVVRTTVLPDDRAFKQFIKGNELEYPELRGASYNRWSVGVLESTRITPNLRFNINAEQVSDDYYLQDFSSNLAQMTERQLLRQADLTLTTDHWVYQAMVQSYQTLHPVNVTPIASVYERLPQLSAHGVYYNLPMHANLNILGQYDQFHRPNTRYDRQYIMPQGPRLYLNPILSVPTLKPWGFFTPSVELVEDYYQVENNGDVSTRYYNRTIPRYNLDSGLYYERNLDWFGSAYTQTLEPRLFYLHVPYHDQTPIPVYDSGYMIFNQDQLFRTNRFSGFDRFGDANQLSYAVTTRWLSEMNGDERASLAMGQIRYFAKRRVKLCHNAEGLCLDNPYMIGYLSPTYDYSPVTSRGRYNFNTSWSLNADYIWDPATRATNNGDFYLHYQTGPRMVANLGYNYLVNADPTQLRPSVKQDNALHQALVSLGWPLTDRWSTLGAYSYNISKNYSMMTLMGVQYDSCCWTMRLVGGRSFKSLTPSFEPQYDNSIYFQVLLKGLGSVGNSDPYNLLNTYIPGYNDPFKNRN